MADVHDSPDALSPTFCPVRLAISSEGVADEPDVSVSAPNADARAVSVPAADDTRRSISLGGPEARALQQSFLQKHRRIERQPAIQNSAESLPRISASPPDSLDFVRPPSAAGSAAPSDDGHSVSLYVDDTGAFVVRPRTTTRRSRSILGSRHRQRDSFLANPVEEKFYQTEAEDGAENGEEGKEDTVAGSAGTHPVTLFTGSDPDTEEMSSPREARSISMSIRRPPKPAKSLEEFEAVV